MKIISKVSDYYDGVFSIPDPTLVYIRKEETVDDQHIFNGSSYRGYYSQLFSKNIKQYKHKLPLYSHSVSLNNDNYRAYDEYQLSLLGFCGKTYIFAKERKYGSSDITYIWDKDIIIEKMTEKGRYWVSSSRKEELLNLFSDWDNKLNYDIFRELNCPVFLVNKAFSNGDVELIKNPLLKPLNFATQFDAAQCAQELYMFMDNHLRPKEEMTEVSDESKIASRGFDEKSFRNRGKSPKRRNHRK